MTKRAVLVLLAGLVAPAPSDAATSRVRGDGTARIARSKPFRQPLPAGRPEAKPERHPLFRDESWILDLHTPPRSM